MMDINYFLSSDGKTQVAYYIYDNNVVQPRAVLQISHGMQEHLTRYSHLAAFLNAHGIVVCGNDHLGHGRTSISKETDGFFAAKHGADYVLHDLYKLTKIVKEKYSGLPYFLMGHSMGSFFARAYATSFPNELNGLILCGTSGRVTGTILGLFILNILKIFKGKKAHSGLAENIMSGSYFKYIDNVQSKKEWITSSQEDLNNYLQNDRCQIRFTVSAYYDMVCTLKKVNKKSWAKKIPKDLPVFLVSGACDPVGQYGKGVCQVYSMLEKQKVKNVDLRLYACGRHEPFNEVQPIKSMFYNDILQWLENHIND
ncbi:MAG: alpha/beta hydrolase [Clostridiales bacterium]|nr:alpha/beta hydrolase [Clostridiales bacterium]